MTERFLKARVPEVLYQALLARAGAEGKRLGTHIREVLERDAIRKTFHFPDFSAAFAFMTQVALLAEKWAHHPEWFNDEGRVEIILFSRDVEGVTGRDIEMAHRIDQLAPAHDK